ncbi:urease accessory protein UreF [Rhodococcus sp. X156]|uniref:urease accessory protein UreF n=1 Tax=Rhodococcus sp. X156 TaxID=2499145 RepID=UPI000FD9E28A|nr:urease accessory protein UreF [Rhodococcus sp. X156]
MTRSPETGPDAITRTMRVMEFGDSMLPIGAFSFSSGLESAVAQQEVTGPESLREYVHTATHQAATGDGVAVLQAHRAALAGDFAGVLSADHAVTVRKLNEETRLMSVRMGKKLGQLGTRLTENTENPVLGTWLSAITSGEAPGTFPAGLGVVFAEMGSPEEDAFAVHQYGVAMTILGAALRLLRVDHTTTQSILFAVNEQAAEEYALVRDRALTDMCTFAPMTDVLAAVHVQAHVRMFMN